MSDARFRLCLAKEDFKFSVAHFTVFSAERAELLHGHNYRVAVELAGPRLGELGLLAEVEGVKEEIRRLCEQLDSRVLVPAANPHLQVSPGEGSVAIAYRARRYTFPAADTVLLPLANVSMELLARHLWQALLPALADGAVDHLTVSVEESSGQRAVYESSLPGG